MIPIDVFQVCIGLLLTLFSIAVPSYWFRRTKFPIAQRLPKVVTCEMILVTCAALLELLASGFPQSSIFADCKTFVLATSVVYYCIITLITWRLTWVIVKNFNTQALVEHSVDEKGSENSSPSIGNCFRRVQNKVNGLILKHFSIQQVVVIVMTPAACCAISDITWITMYAPRSLNLFADDCYFQVMYLTNVLRCVIALLLIFLVCFGFTIIWSLKDSLCLGIEIRAMFIPNTLVGIFNLITASRSSFGQFVFQSSTHHLLMGSLIIPSVLFIQALFPVFLSLRQQNAEKNYRENQAAFQGSKSEKLLEDREMSSISFRNEADHVGQMKSVIENGEGRLLFMRFLEKEFSAENLLFYEAVVQYEKELHSQDPELVSKARESAQMIFDTYVSTSSSLCVNISAITRKKITKVLGKRRQKTALAQVQESLKKSKLLNGSSQGAFLELNVSSATIQMDPEVFGEAKSEIVQLMVRDSFFRFRMTPEFNRFQRDRTI
jgi:hypothetical protein